MTPTITTTAVTAAEIFYESVKLGLSFTGITNPTDGSFGFVWDLGTQGADYTAYANIHQDTLPSTKRQLYATSPITTITSITGWVHGLTANTLYYYRGFYQQNGTYYYGDEETFTTGTFSTPASDPDTDIGILVKDGGNFIQGAGTIDYADYLAAVTADTGKTIAVYELPTDEFHNALFAATCKTWLYVGTMTDFIAGVPYWEVADYTYFETEGNMRKWMLPIGLSGHGSHSSYPYGHGKYPGNDFSMMKNSLDFGVALSYLFVPEVNVSNQAISLANQKLMIQAVIDRWTGWHDSTDTANYHNTTKEVLGACEWVGNDMAAERDQIKEQTQQVSKFVGGSYEFIDRTNMTQDKARSLGYKFVDKYKNQRPLFVQAWGHGSPYSNIALGDSYIHQYNAGLFVLGGCQTDVIAVYNPNPTTYKVVDYGSSSWYSRVYRYDMLDILGFPQSEEFTGNWDSTEGYPGFKLGFDAIPMDNMLKGQTVLDAILNYNTIHPCGVRGVVFGDPAFALVTSPALVRPPSSLTATAWSTTGVTVTWTKGTNADKTLVVYSYSTPPLSPQIGGTVAYFGTAETCTIPWAGSGQLGTCYIRAYSYKASTGAGRYSAYFGDAQQDGYLGIADTIWIERIILGLETPTPEADADQDGKIDASDVTEMTTLLVNGNGTEIVLPAPSYGFALSSVTTSGFTLTWTGGSDKTLVRYSTSRYPTSTADGTQLYWNTGTSVTATSLTAGIGYYITAWSYDNTTSLYSQPVQFYAYTITAAGAYPPPAISPR